MNNLSVIIPSKTLSNLIPCVEAVQRHEPDARIIVIDDGLAGRVDGCAYVDGIKEFIFARNVNLGLEAAGGDDCVVLNDDAILATPLGLTIMQRAAYEQPEYGLIAATTNVTGNPNQHPRGVGLREETKGSIPFICVLLPRRTIDDVGFMDERFGGTTADGRRIYGFCDNDMCRRIKNIGLKLGIHDGCFVDHGSLRSSFRGDPWAAGDISAAKELYLQKWGSLD